MKIFAVTIILAVCAEQVLSACRDNYGENFCGKVRDNCNESDEIKRNCQLTCGTCGDYPDQTPTPAPPAHDIPANDCINENGDTWCFTNRQHCEESYMITHCRKECGCDKPLPTPAPGTPAPNPTCINRWGDTMCSESSEFCDEPRMKINCRKQCNACDEPLPEVTPAPVTPVPDIPPAEDILDCYERFPNLCAVAAYNGQCYREYKKCPIACGLCTPEPNVDEQEVN